jgi:glycerate kinase
MSDPRRIIVAPDSFKGSFAAAEVATAIAEGVALAGLAVEKYALADGGEGTMAAIREARGGEVCVVQARDPLGRPVRAEFLMLDGGTAVLDCAAASGLPLVAPELRDALGADSAGTGDLIVAAIDAGAKRVMVAAGGSASTDGGRGAIEAIEAAGGLKGARLTVLCDVQTPFEDAASVFAPQKGATAAQVALLGERMAVQARALPRDPRGRPMTGAAGGLAGGLWATFDAKLTPGAQFVLATVGLPKRLAAARAAITGEGRLDEQSLQGKLVGALASLCARVPLPLHAVVGEDALGATRAGRAGITSVREAGTTQALVEAGARLGEAIAASRPRADR